jgi:transcriptional repressor NrdR
MRCPYCKFEDTRVTDSRNIDETNSIKRRRECLKCNQRFTTFEALDLTLQVEKKDGTYEDFQEEKLKKGLEAACCHTKVSHENIRALIDKIKAELLLKQVHSISSHELGEMVMHYLHELDVIAYIRFACVYRRFKELGELMEAIELAAPEKSKIKKEEHELCH